MKVKVKDLYRLNELIIIRGMNKAEFAKAIDLSPTMTVQITKGDRSPSPKAAKRIVEVLQCEWHDVFEVVNEQTSSRVALAR
ncbi:helix-turn-helix transcriptional regulator [Brevibacillus reuszeri]|uniref:helix-turn-helix transcriptional regulator n=1 Tax=Brevibacillus reuszeri TaxID=54915 RepID=UPI000CCBE606|nr:helix-turn-helix transcriptional regulator [Brevibacillus reuszeri]